MDEHCGLMNGVPENEGSLKIDIDNPCEETDELISFNVSGRIFTTTFKTLGIFPNSLLGNKETRDKLQRTRYGEIFLNRNAAVFESVFTFYQNGIFEPPTTVNQNIFVKDITYYGLVTEAIESGLNGFDLYVVPFPKRKWQAFLWNVLEYPDSSLLARIVSIFSLSIIIISIIIFCWETLPDYKKPLVSKSESRMLTANVLNDVEIFCIVYFTVELVGRFLISPVKQVFIKDILNIIDFVSILPFYITLIFEMEGDVSIYFLRAVRLVRVFRVFKLSRHSSEMKILGIAVKDSARELGVLVFFILLGVLLFSSAVYYAEAATENTKLKSIPGAFWWSIVTMTTVGYGDEVPLSTPGRIVGAVCAMTGILVIALPIPIIVNNFTRQYQQLKPVSKYWNEFQSREQVPVVKSTVVGLFHICELDSIDSHTRRSRRRSDKIDENVNIIEVAREGEEENEETKKVDEEINKERLSIKIEINKENEDNTCHETNL